MKNYLLEKVVFPIIYVIAYTVGTVRGLIDKITGSK